MNITIEYQDMEECLKGRFLCDPLKIIINKKANNLDKEYALYHEFAHYIGFLLYGSFSNNIITQKIEECIADESAYSLMGISYEPRFSRTYEEYKDIIIEESNKRKAYYFENRHYL